MREISFVNRLKFNFAGSVAKRALVVGDADNDKGDLAIFKDCNPNRHAFATDLGMVTVCVIGDIINSGKNNVSAINTEGWLFIFDVSHAQQRDTSPEVIDASTFTHESPHYEQHDESFGLRLRPLYDQRMPANCKELLLADLDGDGQNEVIIGLTDRVLRTYKWIKIGPDKGKFVGLYKWEFADQIGAVSLNASRHENCQDILVAQPGGTYAKLECFDKKPTINSNSTSNSSSNDKKEGELKLESHQDTTLGSSASGDYVRTEYISKLTPEYHQLALSQMRNHHISTEILGGIRNCKDSDSYSLVVIATLDGTLMLVNKNEILWSLQVDHQLFALAVLNTPGDRTQPMLSQSESTCTIVPTAEYQSILSIHGQHSNMSNQDLATSAHKKSQQYFVVCAWNGKTYIIDEDRNYLRFKFDEAVSAFAAGTYFSDGQERTCLVYATFNNQIVLYYDVVAEQIRPMYLLDEILNNPLNEDLRMKLELLAKRLKILPSADTRNVHFDNQNDHSDADATDASATNLHSSPPTVSDSETKLLHSLLRDILYNLRDSELNLP